MAEVVFYGGGRNRNGALALIRYVTQSDFSLRNCKRRARAKAECNHQRQRAENDRYFLVITISLTVSG